MDKDILKIIITVAVTITIGSISIYYARKNYLRNKRLDRESEEKKAEEKKKADESAEKKKKDDAIALKKLKLEHLPKFVRPKESTQSVVGSTIEYFLHNFGKTAKKFSLEELNDETVIIRITPRNITVFHQFDRLHVSMDIKNNLRRDQVNYKYRLHFEDELGHRYFQDVEGTANGFTISEPNEITD